jgi:hypothetical protein
LATAVEGKKILFSTWYVFYMTLLIYSDNFS